MKTMGCCVFCFTALIMTLAHSQAEGETSKITTQPNGRERFKVEHDDILRLAAEHQLDYLSVQQAVNDEVTQILGHGT